MRTVLSATKRNNIETIKNFIINDNCKNLLINEFSEEVSLFYILVINNIAKENGIKLLRETEDKNLGDMNDLFDQKKIQIFNTSNSKKIDEMLHKKFQKIVICDYKNYKKFSKLSETINSYQFEHDIRYYLENNFKINHEELINYCISQPHLMNSEITKYKINNKKYLGNPKIYEVENFILEIRKEIYKTKNSDINIKKLFLMLKNEVKYKKFNFLTF
tara:strand:- start:641 stop:1294 length:654 start_codon:yes stop_codon:yes gene_type:complete